VRCAQVLLHGQEGLMGDEANPFQEDSNEQLASVAYRRAVGPVMRGALLSCRRCLLPRTACPWRCSVCQQRGRQHSHGTVAHDVSF